MAVPLFGSRSSGPTTVGPGPGQQIALPPVSSGTGPLLHPSRQTARQSVAGTRRTAPTPSRRAGRTLPRASGPSTSVFVGRFGAPGGTRTHDLQVRNLTLYPLSYGRAP